MIDAIRAYFKSVIKAVDSDLKSDKLIFDNADTADHNLDTTYKMVIGSMGIIRQDADIISTVPVSVIIYKVSNIDKLQADFDKEYCKAIDITSRAMNQSLIDQTDYIKSVVGESITPTPLEDNNNTMQFTLNFNVTITYKYVL